MGIMETIKRGFSIVNKNIKLLVALFVFNLIGALIRIPFVQTGPGARVPGPVVVLSILLGLIGVLIFGGILCSLKDYIQTQKTELGKFIGYGSKFYLRILGVWALMALILIGFTLVVAFAISMATAIRNLVGTVIFLAIALIVGSIGIYIFVLLFMSPYILVADDIGPVSALKRSMAFVRKNLRKIIGLFLLLILLSIGIGFIVGIIAGLTTLAIKGAAGQVIIGIVASAFNAYINILLPACFLLIYLSSKPKESTT